MQDYGKEVKQEAVDFLLNQESMIVDALENDSDFDQNEIEGLDSAWHENIVDRSYSLQDAAYILENCENEESDSGLWEGRDARETLSAMAAYSYSNDVWSEAEELYNEIKERMDELLEEEENSSEDLEDEADDESPEKVAAQKAFDEFRDNNALAAIKPVEKGSPEELRQIEIWLRLNAEAGTWGGFPVGGSYIDARCGSGHGMPEIKEYVDFDREFSRRVPWLSGKYKNIVQARHDELKNKDRPAMTGEEAWRTVYEQAKAAAVETEPAKKVYLDTIVHAIMTDKCLSLPDIRAIIRMLENRT